MFVMDCYGHKLYNGVLFAHHLILDVPGGSSHLGYRRRVAICNNPPTRVKYTGGSTSAYTATPCRTLPTSTASHDDLYSHYSNARLILAM